METVDRLSLQTRATRFVNIHIYASWWARVLPGTSRISYNLVVPGMSMSGNLSPPSLYRVVIFQYALTGRIPVFA